MAPTTSQTLARVADILMDAYPYDTRVRLAVQLLDECILSVESLEALRDDAYERMIGYDPTAGLRSFIAGMATANPESVSDELVDWAATTPGESDEPHQEDT